jgi:hypothetical protein
MGSPAGTLPDGTALYSMVGMEPENQVRWLEGGLLVMLGSDDISMSELKTLAANVSVK